MQRQDRTIPLIHTVPCGPMLLRLGVAARRQQGLVTLALANERAYRAPFIPTLWTLRPGTATVTPAYQTTLGGPSHIYIQSQGWALIIGEVVGLAGVSVEEEGGATA